MSVRRAMATACLAACLVGAGPGESEDVTTCTRSCGALQTPGGTIWASDIDVLAVSYPVVVSIYDMDSLTFLGAFWADPRHHEVPLLISAAGGGTTVEDAALDVPPGRYFVSIWEQYDDIKGSPPTEVSLPLASTPGEPWPDPYVRTTPLIMDSHRFGCATWCITAEEQRPTDGPLLHFALAHSPQPLSEGSTLGRSMACHWTDGEPACSEDRVVAVAGGLQWSVGSWPTPDEATWRCYGAGGLGELNAQPEDWAVAAVFDLHLEAWSTYQEREWPRPRDGWCLTPGDPLS